MRIVKGFTWSLVPSVQVMLVDNVNANGMVVSSPPLPSNLYMVQWREGRGEVETTTAPGLRTIFTDVSPYCPAFQQFMTIKNGQGALTLAQAQKIQNDLINCLYDDKRQQPYAYTPAGGTSQNWSADDTDIAAMSLEAIPFISGGSSSGLNSLVTQINAMIDSINSSIVVPGNSHASAVNTINSNLNGSAFPNLKLSGTGIVGGGNIFPSNVAAPGLPSGFSTGAGSANNMSSIAHIGGSGAGSANIPWSPIGATTPINLTMNDLTGIMTGISTRRQTLLNTHNSKQAAVNALSTVAAVIAFSVTAGW
jgi:hypothetical protein